MIAYVFRTFSECLMIVSARFAQTGAVLTNVMRVLEAVLDALTNVLCAATHGFDTAVRGIRVLICFGVRPCARCVLPGMTRVWASNLWF